MATRLSRQRRRLRFDLLVPRAHGLDLELKLRCIGCQWHGELEGEGGVGQGIPVAADGVDRLERTPVLVSPELAQQNLGRKVVLLGCCVGVAGTDHTGWLRAWVCNAFDASGSAVGRRIAICVRPRD